MAREWMVYDPGWLVELARTVEAEEPGLADAFSHCTQCLIESEAYIYFVDPREPNQPGSEWQFDRNVVLESSSEGIIVVDVLTSGRIGGIEFFDRL